MIILLTSIDGKHLNILSRKKIKLSHLAWCHLLEELELAFKYELCSHPPALFYFSQLLEAHKPRFAAAIGDLFGPYAPSNISNDGIPNVLDDRTLLWHMPCYWGSTYRGLGAQLLPCQLRRPWPFLLSQAKEEHEIVSICQKFINTSASFLDLQLHTVNH